MRAAFGLVGLLVVLGIVMLIFKYIEAPTLERGKQAQDEARQISGRGDDGVAAVDSFKIDPQFRGSQLDNLEVTEVTAGGALAAYGLQKGDRILQVNGMKIGDLANNDPEMAKAQVHNAFQASQPIIVLRTGAQVTLPTKSGASPNPLQSLNGAVKIPTH